MVIHLGDRYIFFSQVLQFPFPKQYYFKMLASAKMNFANSFYMETFRIGAWQVWKQRNNLIFEKSQPLLQDWEKKTFH